MADFGTVARPYAKALFDIASRAGELAEWSQSLGAAADVVADAAAKSFLARPELRPEQRAEFLMDICTSVDHTKIMNSPAGKNFLRLLAENDRLTALAEISARFDQLKIQAENKVNVTLVSATEVDESVSAKIASALEKKLGRSVELELEVDPSLLGGAIVRAEDRVIDGSVRSRLQQLADTLID